MLVVDLSSNNQPPKDAEGNLNFEYLRAHGVGGVWLKATEGHSYTNPVYKTWRAAAEKAGLRVGAYHFARPDTGNTAGEEAEHFCNVVGKPGRRDLRPVLDYENLRGRHGEDENWIRGWNQWTKAAIGVGPLFYSYPWLIEQLKLATPVGYGLWLADYGADDGKPHPFTVPAPWKKAAAHQYTSKGHVGSYGPVDLTETFGLAVYAHPVTGLV